jgi:hypothetical protein
MKVSRNPDPSALLESLCFLHNLWALLHQSRASLLSHAAVDSLAVIIKQPHTLLPMLFLYRGRLLS